MNFFQTKKRITGINLEILTIANASVRSYCNLGRQQDMIDMDR
jgi:hypothetical protein